MPRCLRAVGEIDEIAERAVARIDAVVVRHVVSVVTMGRRLERHQPNGRDAEAVEIVQASRQTAEVANAIAIGIHVGADRQAIDDGVLVPKVTDHDGPGLLRRRRSDNDPFIRPQDEGGRRRLVRRRVSVERRTCRPDQDGSVSSFGRVAKIEGHQQPLVCLRRARSTAHPRSTARRDTIRA